MGRMHSRRKGVSSSALPYKRTRPSWISSALHHESENSRSRRNGGSRHPPSSFNQGSQILDSYPPQTITLDPNPPPQTLILETQPTLPPSETLDQPQPSLPLLLPTQTLDKPPVSVDTHRGTDRDASGGEEEATISSCRRRSRWDLQPDSSDASSDPSGSGQRKRKSCWAEDDTKPGVVLPDFMKDFAADPDLEIRSLNIRLLQSDLPPLNDRPEGARSPSSSPSTTIWASASTPASTVRGSSRRSFSSSSATTRRSSPLLTTAPKLQKKLYIPMEYPDYNFIGLKIK